MYILPAIDLKDGKVVRLYKGDFNTVHQVAQDPLETARAFSEAGARWIHMVDPGRSQGRHPNQRRDRGGGHRPLRSPGGAGGGIRCMEDLEAVFQAGVGRAVIGSAAVSDPDFVRAAAERYGERVAVGIEHPGRQSQDRGLGGGLWIGLLGVCKVYDGSWNKEYYLYRY